MLVCSRHHVATPCNYCNLRHAGSPRYSLKDYLSLRRDQDKGLSRGAVKNISKVPKMTSRALHGKIWVQFFWAGVPPWTMYLQCMAIYGLHTAYGGRFRAYWCHTSKSAVLCFVCFKWKMWSHYVPFIFDHL